MSINSCSINEFTINTLCGRRRQAIINSLRPTVQEIKGHVQHVGKLPFNIYKREEDNIFEQTELSHIQVSVSFNGETYSQTLERNTNIPLLSIGNILVNEISLNIDDITIRIKE